MSSILRQDTAHTPVINIWSMPPKVCLHVLRSARGDVRAMRAASTLVEAGYRVSVVDVEIEREQVSTEKVAGIRMRHIILPDWYTSRRNVPLFLLCALQLFIASVIALYRTKADIYHASEVTALPASYFVARLRRKPLIFEAYELPLSNEKKIGYWRYVLGGMQWLLRRILPHCASIITTSPMYAQEIRAYYGVNNVSLVRNIPPYQTVVSGDALRTRLGLGAEKKIALYQGYIQEDRRLELLVHAAEFLAPEHVIVLMGKDVGTTKAELEALIADKHLAERVKILPPVPYEELLTWTASADVGLIILPTDYSLSIRYTLPNKLFEYLMAGLPVLSSPLVAVAEVVRAYDVGVVVASNAPADIGKTLNTMLADTAGLARQRENALMSTRDEFCWEHERAQLLHIYAESASLRGKGEGIFNNAETIENCLRDQR